MLAESIAALQRFAVLDRRLNQFLQLFLIVGVDRLVFQSGLQRILQAERTWFATMRFESYDC